MKKLVDHVQTLMGKKVLVRCNFDVPIEDGVVQDTTRIEDAVSTLQLLLEHKAIPIILAHQNRPDGAYKASSTLKPVAIILSELLSQPISFVEYAEDITQLKFEPNQPIYMVDNLRFWAGEEANDEAFTQSLASFGEAYVNQAFAVCHRKHASMVGLPGLLDSYAGVNLAKEVDILAKSRNNPDKPLAVVIGGAKLETKEPLVGVFAHVADNILVGGKVAVDLREKGTPLPDNVTVAELIENGRDITPESAQKFSEIIDAAKTVIWNGTMGVFEEEEHQAGTKVVATAVDESPAFTVVGGGDTETALTVLGLEEKIDFISTGGGAMLTFLSEGTLPALEALD